MSNIKLNYNLSKNSWFGLGGLAKKYFSPTNEEELISYLKNNLDEKLITIGSGSNILFRDKGCLETIIKLGKEFQKIEIKNEKIYCGAAALKSQLSKFAYENSIKNYEFLSCIPGTVGGGVIMNAGCFNFEFKDIVIEVEGINKKGDKICMQNKEIEFDYRQTKISEDIIITKIIFKVFKGDKNLILEKTEKLKNKKSISQPSKIKTGGSTFKNPNFSLKAWELIKKTGCDKKIIGNAKFSESHCNFIENNGTSSKDVEDLIHFTISEVRKKFNITLEPEIKIIGEK